MDATIRINTEQTTSTGRKTERQVISGIMHSWIKIPGAMAEITAAHTATADNQTETARFLVKIRMIPERTMIPDRTVTAMFALWQFMYAPDSIGGHLNKNAAAMNRNTPARIDMMLQIFFISK
jgi:hypothetical protein